MKVSKLIELLKTFEKREWRQFKVFLSSPYFNKRKDIIALYQYLMSLAPDFVEKKLKKEVVFKKVYPKQAYEDKQMKYVMNYLLKQAEQFLIQQKMESDVSLMNNFLLDSLVNRNLEKHYKGRLEKVVDTLEVNKKENVDYPYYRYQLADIANLHYLNQNLRKYDANLQEASNYLDQFYFLNKLKYSCEMISRGKVFIEDYNPYFINDVVNHLANTPLEKAPLIAIYLEIYYTLKKEDSANNFENLKGLIVKFHTDLPATEKKTIYLYAINYCGEQIRVSANKIYYVEECLKLYMIGIAQEFLFSKGYLSPWTFKNVIRLGLNLKRYDWTEEFIQKNYKKLSEEFQEDALHYNLADLFYQRKKYEEAQDHLLQVKYSDIFYTLGAKTLLVKIYYENNEIEALFGLIASFGIFLRRNKKISNNFRTLYLNFLTLLQKILRAKKAKIPILEEKIKQTKLLTDRSWLLQICEDLR